MNAELSLMFTFAIRKQYKTFFELKFGVNAKGKRNLFYPFSTKIFLKKGREGPQMIFLATAKIQGFLMILVASAKNRVMYSFT